MVLTFPSREKRTQPAPRHRRHHRATGIRCSGRRRRRCELGRDRSRCPGHPRQD
uniref:Uncharacterized protein n=1 Tax=Anopheles epiroticus TaxID=199890 RepID=A0A182PLC1_9DIPT